MNRRELIGTVGIGTAAITTGCLGDIASSGGSGADDTNLWGQENLVVGLEQQVSARHGIVDLVRTALDYWEENVETYADYTISFEFRPNAESPDVKIVLVDVIYECQGHDTDERYAGCATVESGERWESATVRIVDGYADAYTLDTLKHEIGHVLGLTHDDEPARIMSDRIEDRIPDYGERMEILDLYAETITAWNEGIEDWGTAVDLWNAENYRSAGRDFSRAENSYREAAGYIADALALAEDIEQSEAAELLRTANEKITLYESAAGKMQIASESAGQEDFEEAERQHTEATEDLETAKSYEIARGEELARALGLPQPEE